MAKFNLGDKVICNRNILGALHGGKLWEKTGTVVALTEYDVCVYFDDFTDGHNCSTWVAKKINDDKYFTGHHCWFVDMGSVDKVEDADIREKFNKMQTEFHSLYHHTGLISIDEDCVHVKEETFKELFDTYTVQPHGEYKTTQRLTAEYKGVKYIALHHVR